MILNAGVSWTPDSTTKEGYEALFGVNHLGHFCNFLDKFLILKFLDLTHLLMDKLRESAPSRLIVVSSDLHAYTKVKIQKIGLYPMDVNYEFLDRSKFNHRRKTQKTNPIGRRRQINRCYEILLPI